MSRGRSERRRPRARSNQGRSLVGQEYEVEVGPVAHGGHCVARHEGRVVFVRHALPGERVRAVVTEDGGGSFCRADAVEVREAEHGQHARDGGFGGGRVRHDPGF